MFSFNSTRRQGRCELWCGRCEDVRPGRAPHNNGGPGRTRSLRCQRGGAHYQPGTPLTKTARNRHGFARFRIVRRFSAGSRTRTTSGPPARRTGKLPCPGCTNSLYNMPTWLTYAQVAAEKGHLSIGRWTNATSQARNRDACPARAAPRSNASFRPRSAPRPRSDGAGSSKCGRLKRSSANLHNWSVRTAHDPQDVRPSPPRPARLARNVHLENLPAIPDADDAGVSGEGIATKSWIS